MNSTYTVREILFGLREYYLKNTRKLQELKRMCMVDYTKAEDYRFYLYDDKIFCDYCENISLIQKVLRTGPNGRVQVVCVPNKNKEYEFVKLDENFPIKFIDYKREYFLDEVTKIRDSSFIKTINNLRISNGINFNQNVVLINPLSMCFTVSFDNGDNLFRLSYVSSQDLIKVNSNMKKVSADCIKNILNVEFEKTDFPDDVRFLIDNSSDINKNVSIETNCINKNYSLRIIEDDEIILEKIKRRW